MITVARGYIYIGYMRETLNYPITIIPLTVISLTPPQMQREWNGVAFEEFTRHATKIKLIHPKSNNKK
jgi:hypothetical protein